MVELFPPRARHHRFASAATVLYRGAGEQRWEEAVSRNISVSGVLFCTPQPPPPRALLELRIALRSALGQLPAGTLVALGRVTRVQEDAAAVRFDDVRLIPAAVMAPVR